MEKFKIIQGSYIEWSIFVRWKLFIRILNELFFFDSLIYNFSRYMLPNFSLLLIFFFVRDLNNCPEVRHIVYRKFSNVYFIYTLCFCTMSFWMFFNFISIF